MERAKYSSLCATSLEHSTSVANVSSRNNPSEEPKTNHGARIVTVEDLETYDKKSERTKQISLLFPSQEVRPIQTSI